MSTNNSTTSGSQVDVDDYENEGDLNKHRRLNAIHDARQQVVDARRKVDEALHHGEISQLTANTIIRRELENYIHEVEWLMNDAETTQDYEGGVQLGSMVFPDGNTFSFVGLQSILEVADPIQHSWTEPHEDDWDGETIEEYEATMQIPRDVLMNAYRAVNGFLFEFGLDLSLDEGGLAAFGFDEVEQDAAEENGAEVV